MEGENINALKNVYLQCIYLPLDLSAFMFLIHPVFFRVKALCDAYLGVWYVGAPFLTNKSLGENVGTRSWKSDYKTIKVTSWFSTYKYMKY